jgi:RNA polymerase sigma-70 factor (ECF subfamily)
MSAVSPFLGAWRRLAFARPPKPARKAEEATLVYGARKRDPDPSVFEAFFWRYEREIIGYLCRMTGDEQAARDLSQEAFLRAWQHFDQLTTPAPAHSWLFRVATNLALNYLQRRSARPMVALSEREPGKSDPGRHIAESDLIQTTLQRLTPKQRSALLLHEVHGLSCDEIGNLLGISRDAVKMALRRARQQFRLLYTQDEESSR